MIIDSSSAGSVVVRDGDAVVMEYVFAADDPTVESPRPYAILRTLDGKLVTGYRPDDHPWHKGFSLALPHVGPHNFWGGPTYLHDAGYVQMANNGSQVHRAFDRQPEFPGVAGFAELLDWTTQDGVTLLSERRVLSARRLDTRPATWGLSWSSRLINTSGGALAFGSPSASGRESAGYAGLFWRGPESFTGGAVETPEGVVGEAARGRAYPWVAYQAPDDDIGVLVVDADPGGPHPWFVRSEDLAGLCATPFYYTETLVPSGSSIEFGAVVAVGGRDVVASAITATEALAAELADPGSPWCAAGQEIR